MNNGKVRIYELSKELDLENRDILAVCEQLDIAAKSHSSTITDEDAVRIRSVASEKFTRRSAPPKKPVFLDRPPSRPSLRRPGESPIKKRPQILEVRRNGLATEGSASAKPQVIRPPRAPIRTPLPPSPPQIRDVYEYKKQYINVQYFVEHIKDDIGIEMVLIKGGIFEMGSPELEKWRSNAEGPVHSVTVSEFCMGKYPVTQAQWRAVSELPSVRRDLESAPSHFKGNMNPVESVSWYDAVEFCDRLARKTGRNYRLPTEAEWEYACRAGTKTLYNFGDTITSELASYERSEEQGTTLVNHYSGSNAFGLSDMHGNVFEWCQDHWHDAYEDAPTDGSAWLTDNEDELRVHRGGSWNSNQGDCRSAFRNNDFPSDRFRQLGFRVVCQVP